MSKDFGIAGIRCGYAVMNCKRVKKLLNSGFLWNSNGMAEYFWNLLSDKNFSSKYEECRQKYLDDRENCYKNLKKIKEIFVYPSASNFFLIDLKTIPSFELVCWMLIEKGIYIRSLDDKLGKGIETDRFIRLASKDDKENLLVFDALNQFLSKS